MSIIGYSTSTKFDGEEGIGNDISTISGTVEPVIYVTTRNTSYTDFEFNCGSITGAQGHMNAGIMFRSTSNSTFYSVVRDYSWGGQYTIRLKKNNIVTDNITGQLASYNNGSTNITSLKITMSGSDISIWINGTLRIEYTDTSPISTGSVGFAMSPTWNSDTVSWSDVYWADGGSSSSRRIFII